MPLTPQQQLCERLYEILPKKKELVFGCEIVIDDMFFYVTDITKKVEYKDGFFERINLRSKYGEVSTSIKNTPEGLAFCEIIGSPLTALDVLTALHYREHTPYFSIQQAGGLIRTSIDETWGHTGISLDLSKTVDKWEDETCLFLIDILK